MYHWLLELDKKIFFFINLNNNQTFDNIFWYISQWYTWILFYFFVVLLSIKKEKKNSIFFISLLILGIGVADVVSTQLFKEVFHRLRPCHTPEMTDFVHIVRGKCGGTYGFVSSHAANFFAIATFTSLEFKNYLYTTISFLIATFVIYSRIYLGVHFPADVIFGAILGSIIGFSIFFLYQKLILKRFSKNI